MEEDGHIFIDNNKEKKISMVKHYKKIGIVFSIISIIVLIVGFFYQFEVDYSDYKRIKLVGGEGFYPDGYRVFHTEKEFLQSATYLYHGKDITKVMKLDFSKYSYVVVQGAKVKRMYYSIKSTLFDDKSPDWAKARRFWKLCLFIEYQDPDGYMYVYQINKNSRLRGFGGD